MSNLFNEASLVLVPSGYKAGKVYSEVPTDGDGDLTFTRASSATRVNSDGEIEVVGSGVPRLDYSQGSCPALLLEPQRTNSIRNSSMVGAVAGSPGTLPSTSWSSFAAGLALTIVGTGNENGLPYIDIRFNGTASATGALIGIETANSIAATVGQSWTESAYCKIISAPTNANSFALLVYERNSSAVYIGEGSTIIVPTSDLQRFTFSRAIAGATAAFVQPYIRANLTNGATYDFTIRIAAPQMELGAYATSYIPTTSATVTRLADACSKDSLSVFGTNVGSFFVDASGPFYAGVASYLFDISDNSSSINNRFALYSTSESNLQLFTNTGTNFTASVTERKKIAVIWNGTNTKLYLNGVKVVDITYANANPTSINLNSRFTDKQYGNSQYYQVLAFPTALTDTQAIALTTL